MFCVQCGFKIQDGYKFCPNCGAKVVSVQDDTQQNHEIPSGELDRIADDIFWNAPQDTIGCAKHLSMDTGLEKKEAQRMMNDRYREWKLGKKNGKYPDTEYCPCCASKNIEYYHKPGIFITRQSSAFKSVMISSQTDGVDMMKCQRCGHKWVPKKRR